MADVEATTSDAPVKAKSPKKTKAAKPKKPRTAPSHPKVSDMVTAAIKNLKERGGSSLQAIKKYIASNYKVDVDKLSPFIKKYLKNAVASKALIQTKGKGASGSFKLNSTKAEGEKPKKTVKKAAPKAAKKTKTTAAAKKTTKKPAQKKTAAAKPKKAKTPKKEKKPKTPRKPKAPKPKKAAKKASPKKKK